jgi:uncharacterized repeat protein (TIGR03847 family)
MADRVLDMHPSRVTIDALGPPGERIFLLQASQGDMTVTLKIEKQQAAVLAASLDRMLEELARQFPREVSRLEEPISSDLIVQEPFEVLFAIGQMGLGYDQSEDTLVLVMGELTTEEEAGNARIVRMWVTRGQVKALSRHAQQIVAMGRPTCPLCGQPIDPDGHFCPKTNGRERIH